MVFAHCTCMYVFVCASDMQLENLCLPADPRVTDKVLQLSKCGVRQLAEMRRNLQHYVENDLFSGCTPHPRTDARYWPSGQMLLNMMRRASAGTQ